MKIDGHTAAELSEIWGVAVSTIYQWKELPKWASSWLTMESKVKQLERDVEALKRALRSSGV